MPLIQVSDIKTKKALSKRRTVEFVKIADKADGIGRLVLECACRMKSCNGWVQKHARLARTQQAE